MVDTYHEGGSDDGSLCDCPESLFAVRLPQHWWVVYAAHAFEYDSAAGGIRKFFDNHNGLTNAETEAAFAALGLNDLSTYFRIAARIYSRYSQILEDADSSGMPDAELSELDYEFSLVLSAPYRLMKKSGDPRATAADYVRKNFSLYI
ncbi:MAG: DUF4375 domain-containing protein [Verrucomicrobia bacterium]|nr:DUF4375 domain-containing protein [Verrucomicrobiota bacterium]